MAKSLKTNALYSFLRAFMNLVFPVITFPYASRILGPEGIGAVNFSNSFVTYFIILAGLGISTYATRECARLKNDKDALSKYVKEIFIINLISTIIAYTLFFIVFFTVPKLDEYKYLLLLLCANIFFTTLGIEWLYNGLEDFKYIAIRYIIFQSLSLIYLFIFVKSSKDIIHYAFFGMSASVCSNICNWIHARKIIFIKTKQKLEFKKHFKYIFTFFGMSLVTSIYTMFDSTMLGFLSTNAQVGYYSAATKLNRMVLGLITSITAILLPRLTVYTKDNQIDEFSKLCRESFDIVILVSLPTVFGLIALAEPLVKIFCGSEYLQSIPTMNLISPIIFIMSLSNICGTQILPSINKEKISLVSYIIGAIINLSINFILIPKYGTIGAAIGTLCAESTILLIQFVSLHKLLLSKDLILNLIESILVSVFIFIIMIIVRLRITNSFIQVVVCFSIAVVVYAFVMILIKNKTFLKLLKEFKKRF